MRTIVQWQRQGAVVLLGLTILAARASAADEPTALALIKEGNRYVGEHARDKVVEIRSDKSVGGLTPTIWYVRYYDHTATFKTTEVKFGSGKMLDVDRPFHVWKKVTGYDELLDRAKVKVDSDKALKLAIGEPLLRNLKLTATALKLERGDTGEPVWKVKIWAAKLRKPEEDAALGELILSAQNGKVIENDLNIGRVD